MTANGRHPFGDLTPNAPLLTAEQVGEILQVSSKWVYAEARAGRLPFVQVGPRYKRFRADAIEEWIAAQERGAPGLRPGGLSDG